MTEREKLPFELEQEAGQQCLARERAQEFDEEVAAGRCSEARVRARRGWSTRCLGLIVPVDRVIPAMGRCGGKIGGLVNPSTSP
jgi:hypothetical protein